MKKMALFIGVFIAAYFIIQIGSGIILTMFFTPDFSMAWGGAPTSGSIVGKNEWLPGLIIAVIALGIALGITKRFVQKSAR